MSAPLYGGTPWEDTDSLERADWRTRAAYVDNTDEPVFEIDYRVCRRCQLGWVEVMPCGVV